MNSVKNLTDREIIERLCSNSDCEFEAFFFHKQCVPLLSMIRWSVYDNLVPLDELAHELMLLLKKDNWSKLRNFEFRSSLFQWLRIIALNHFKSKAVKKVLKPKEQFPDPNDEKAELDIESNSLDDIKKLLNKVDIPKYKDILRMRYLERKTDGEICKNNCFFNVYI